MAQDKDKIGQEVKAKKQEMAKKMSGRVIHHTKNLESLRKVKSHERFN